MTPSKIMFVDAIPKTPSGKLNKRQLPVPTDFSSGPTGEFTAPRTPTEESLAAIFGELLHVNRVGIHDNFFDLGGHSLIATQLASRIRAQLDVELPLRTLFDRPTVAQLAQAIDASAITARISRKLSLFPSRPTKSPFPLPSSVCGSSINWNPQVRNTISRTRFG